jgi:hypothetical protein
VGEGGERIGRKGQLRNCGDQRQCPLSPSKADIRLIADLNQICPDVHTLTRTGNERLGLCSNWLLAAVLSDFLARVHTGSSPVPPTNHIKQVPKHS